jgi:hypothetical protein
MKIAIQIILTVLDSVLIELVKAMRQEGHDVHFGTMLFHTDDFYGTNNAIMMANLLRCFC